MRLSGKAARRIKHEVKRGCQGEDILDYPLDIISPTSS